MNTFPVLIVGCTQREEELLRQALQQTAPHARPVVTRTGLLAVSYLAHARGDTLHSPHLIVVFFNSFLGPALEVLRWIEEQPLHARPPLIAVAEKLSAPTLDGLARCGLLPSFTSGPDWPTLARTIANHLPWPLTRRFEANEE